MDIWKKRAGSKEGIGQQEISKEELSAFIGGSVHINGLIQCNGFARIDGKIEGEVLSRDTIVIGEGGEIKGQLKVNNLIIKGRVEGDIYSNGKVEIKTKGKVIGNITTPVLIMEEGAFFEGNCSMKVEQSQ